MDICVIGAGPAGSVLAARLAQMGWRVGLVERADFPRRRLGESLSPGVVPMLESLGAGPAIEIAGYPRVRQISVGWDGEQIREDAGGGGMLVDRGSFDALLLQHARACGVRVFQPAAVSRMNRCAGGWMLHVNQAEDGCLIHARLVADATGRRGFLPRHRRRTGPKTLALHAYWQGASLPRIPRIEAGAAHWCWGVPLPDGVYNTLVFLDPQDLRGRPGGLRQRFHELMAASTLLPGNGHTGQAGPVLAVDATPYLDDECVTDDSIKVGDAALALDPLSSTGVQKAVQSALAGAVVVNTLLRRPEACGLAHQFYRDSLRESSRRHSAWARDCYARVAGRQPTEFWRARAEPAPQPDAPPAHAEAVVSNEVPLRLAPDVKIVDLPCVVDQFIESRAALTAPRLERPVAFLGGREVAELLRDARSGASAIELVGSWHSRMPAQDGWAVVQWLTSRGLLVPDREAACSSPGGRP